MPPREPRLTGRLDTEIRMLTAAIEMVAGGTCTRMTLGGLEFGEQLLRRARAMAAPAGVQARALYGTDETAGTDIVIERAT